MRRFTRQDVKDEPFQASAPVFRTNGDLVGIGMGVRGKTFCVGVNGTYTGSMRITQLITRLGSIKRSILSLSDSVGAGAVS
jgi:hypothetical protein